MSKTFECILQLNNNLKAWAKANRMSFAELESRIGVSQGYFSRVIAGKREGIGLDIVIKASMLTGLSLNELLYQDVAMEELKKKTEKIKDILDAYVKTKDINTYDKVLAIDRLLDDITTNNSAGRILRSSGRMKDE